MSITIVETPASPEAQSVDALVRQVRRAQTIFRSYDQETVDHIFKAAAIAAAGQRIPLSKLAVEETGMGVMEDKVIKNHFASEYIYHKYETAKTCGVIDDDTTFGYREIAEPIGIVAGIVPTTNPTSTAIFKALLALKTRNGIVFSPHPRAKRCTALAARIIHDAAVKAGAPEGIIACIDEPTLAASQALMHHPEINLILATGGPGMVNAAYSSGKPAIGVGAGNTPVLIDERADLKPTVSSVIMSKTFDNGVICASEQAVVIVDEVYDAMRAEFITRGCHILSAEEKAKVAEVMVKDGHISATVVGQPAAKIAAMAGIEVDPKTKVLIAECETVGDEEPFAMEKLSPILAMYRADDFDSGLQTSRELLIYGGAGHTAVLYTDTDVQDRIVEFQRTMIAGRVLVNMPASQGAIGDVYNFRLAPSLTLGCGSWGGNSVSENIGVKHLLNIKQVAERRENMQWFRVPPKIYFKRGCLPVALEELRGRQRAYIMTDPFMEKIGFVKRITDVLDRIGVSHRVYSAVRPDPDLSTIHQALEEVNRYEPDTFISLGGGSPMDAAKITWLLYEKPDLKFEDVALRFMDIRKRIVAFPELGRKAVMISIPTTSGSGSEVTPFAVITDDHANIKYPIADYELTPDMAIIDPDFVMTMPKTLVAHTGIDALTHAVESFTSVFATNYSDGLAMEAIRLIFKYLPDSYRDGQHHSVAREKMHYAASIAAMAFSNAFLGVCHSMAHKLGSAFNIPHGLANAILLTHVIRYNATDTPTKQGLMPQYKYPWVKGRYARIADMLGVSGGLAEGDRDGRVHRLIEAIEKLKAVCEIPATIRDCGVPEQAFLTQLDELSEQAFDDQCTGGNPRYPLVSEIRDLYLASYYGVSADVGLGFARAAE